MTPALCVQVVPRGLAMVKAAVHRDTNGCSGHSKGSPAASLTPSRTSLSQHESAVLDGYMAAMTDGTLDPLCSYIDGVAECLTLSPGGREPGPQGECDSAAASPAGCDTWLKEIVQAVQEVEHQQKWREVEEAPAQGTGEGQLATGTEDEKEKEQTPAPAQNTAGGEQAESRDEDAKKEELRGKEEMEAEGQRMEGGTINEEATHNGREMREKVEDDEQTKVIKEYKGINAGQGDRKGRGGQAEAPAGRECEDKENVDPCLVGGRGAGSRRGPGLLLPHPPSGTASAGQPLTRGTKERRQLRPRTRRRQYYEDDNISKDDDYLCECENLTSVH